MIRKLAQIDERGGPELTPLTRLAAYVAGCASAAVHLFDSDTQYRVAATGAPLEETPRHETMCVQVVDGSARIVCGDATAEPRFQDRGFAVSGEPVRFYAAFPISDAGHTVGTLCVWDTSPQEITARQVSLLEDIARQAERQLRVVEIAGILDADLYDPVTGAANQAIFEDRLGQALSRRARAGMNVVLTLVAAGAPAEVDLGDGRNGADAVLVEVANRLRATLRSDDTLARVGADQLAVVSEVSVYRDHDILINRLRDIVLAGDIGAPVAVDALVARGTESLTGVLDRLTEKLAALRV